MAPVSRLTTQVHDSHHEDDAVFVDECVVDAVGEALDDEAPDAILDDWPGSRPSKNLLDTALDARVERTPELRRNLGVVGAGF